MKKGRVSIIPFIENADKKKVLISVEKEANIATEEEFYDKTKGIIDNYDYFYIKLKDIESFDISFLQLMISFKNTIEKMNKEIEFDLNSPENIETILTNSGVDVKELFEIKNN